MGDERHHDGNFHELAEELLGDIANPHLEPEWWFDVRTKQAELGPQSPSSDRIGPFKTREEALRAEQIVAERAAAWNDEDD
ncbi:MAG: hypothetical protein BGO95_08200 [Micrococcales bacterium 73-13]|nr:MAG: hypothetical protein BGO95_08200 [Micrococcales bacterium 73-13]